MNKKLKLVFATSFTALVLSACNFNFSYNIPLYPVSYSFGQTSSDVDLVNEDTGIDDAGTYNIKIWCDEKIKELTEIQVRDFEMVNNNKYKIITQIDATGEDASASSMIENVQAGADIFVFAQDQLSRLKTAGALSTITGGMATNVKAESDPEAINAASIDGKLLAFPLTSDNGYFMYYDKSVLKESDMGSIEQICKVLSQKGKKINYPVFSNGWYGASYFMATGCESNWFVNSKNTFVSYEDNYNSDKGFLACKAIKQLKSYANLFTNKDITDMGRSVGAVVSGIWDYTTGYNIIGENLGCCKMPTFFVEGLMDEPLNISSYLGYKLIGVKPTNDQKRLSVCKKLARYLSGRKCQEERFDMVKWGPTNKSVAELPAIKSNPGLKALNEQRPYAKPQGICPSSWFGGVNSLITAIKADSTDAQIRAALAAYEEGLPSLLED